MVQPPDKVVAPKYDAASDQLKSDIHQFLAKMNLGTTMWPKNLLEVKEKLRQIQKLTSLDANNAATHSQTQVMIVVTEVLHLWTHEIATKPSKTALFKQITSLMALLTAYSEDPKQNALLPVKHKKTYFRPIEKTFTQGGTKPEYYAGSKLFIYNKHLLLMIYTQAFHFEEAVFNLYNVCSSFRKLLIRHYAIIERNSIKVPLREIQDRPLSYLIRSPDERYRYKIHINQNDYYQDLTEKIRMFKKLCQKPHKQYQFQVKNHILEYSGLLNVNQKQQKLIQKLFRNNQSLQLNVTLEYNEFSRLAPEYYEWCSLATINSMTIIKNNNNWFDDSNMHHLFLPRRPMLVNSLTFQKFDDFPLLNTLLKIFLQPLKSLCFNFTHESKKLTQNNVDYLIKMIKDLERHLKLQNKLQICIQINSSSFDVSLLDVFKKLGTQNKLLKVLQDKSYDILDFPNIKAIALQYQNQIEFIKNFSVLDSSNFRDFFLISSVGIKSIDLKNFQESTQISLLQQQKIINNLEDFKDKTTESLEISNFNPKKHSILLERILKGCQKMNKLNLIFSGQETQFTEIDPEVLLNTCVNHLVLCNQNFSFTNYIIPHLLNKIKILDLSKATILFENQLNLPQLEELVIKNFNDLFAFSQNISTLKRLTITEIITEEEQKSIGSMIFKPKEPNANDLQKQGLKLASLQYLKICAEKFTRDFWDRGHSFSLRELHIEADYVEFDKKDTKKMLEKICQNLKKGGKFVIVNKGQRNYWDPIFQKFEEVDFNGFDAEITTPRLEFAYFKRLILRSESEAQESKANRKNAEIKNIQSTIHKIRELIKEKNERTQVENQNKQMPDSPKSSSGPSNSQLF